MKDMKRVVDDIMRPAELVMQPSLVQQYKYIGTGDSMSFTQTQVSATKISPQDLSLI